MKMMMAVMVAAVVVSALAAPATESDPSTPVAILKSSFDQDPQGSYSYAFDAANGISRQETGELKAVKDDEGKEQQVVVVRGQYSYPGVDGKQVVVNYVADETGFHADIPKPESRR